MLSRKTPSVELRPVESCNQCLLKQMDLDFAQEEIRNLTTTVESLTASNRTLCFSNRILTDAISKLVSTEMASRPVSGMSRADSILSLTRSVVSDPVSISSSMDSSAQAGSKRRWDSRPTEKRTPTSPKAKRPTETCSKQTPSKKSRKKTQSKERKKSPVVRLQQCIACGATDANRNIARHFFRNHNKDFKGTRALEVKEPLRAIPESRRPRLEDVIRWKGVDWNFIGLQRPKDLNSRKSSSPARVTPRTLTRTRAPDRTRMEMNEKHLQLQDVTWTPSPLNNFSYFF